MRYLFTFVIIFLFVSNISASDQLNPSGKPGAMQSSSPTLKTILLPENLPEEKVPFHTSRLNDNIGNFGREDGHSIQNRTFEAQLSYIILEQLSSTDRENALIEIELTDEVSTEAIQLAKDIQILWNSGNYEQAINELKTFEVEQENTILGVGISWKEPKLISGVEGVDVQIGTRSGIYQMDLDFDVSNGHLFAVLLFDDGVSRGWTVNISADGGSTWSETYYWNSGSYAMNDVDAAVVAGYFWVGHIAISTQDVARMRRFNTTDGTVDATYSFHTIFDFNVEIRDIAVFSNVDNPTFYDRIYYTAITADDSLRFYWADQDGIVWNDFSSDIADADHGLDASWNTNSVSGNYLHFSYVNSNGQLYSAYHGFNYWTNVSLAPATVTTNDVTSVAAYQDTIIIVYEATDALRYRISYNEGTSWLSGMVASGTNFHKPHVTGRMNAGFAVVYQEEVGEPDILWYTRRDYSIVNWSTPAQFNEIDVLTGSKTNIEWIPPVSAPYAHGAIWLTTGAFAYFDRIEEVVLPVPENIVVHSGYHHAVPLYWDPPVGFSPLKTSNSFPGIGVKEMDLKTTNDNSPTVKSIESILQSYNVYRSTTSGGPYTLLANVNRQYYRDLTASNGVTYYYVIEAVFDDGTSPYSAEDSGTPIANGFVISSGWTISTPILDGVISAGEWVEATTKDIKGSGVNLPVTLYTMNNGNYLYFAADDPNNTVSGTYDELGIYFDENHDYEWPPASPSEEGNFWSDYLNGSPETRFREIYGWWPDNTVTGTPVTAIGVNQGISFSSGHVQFEMQIDLSASDLNATPGDDIGIYFFTLDESIGYGNWPTEVDLFGTTWRAPFMYGTLNLADDPTGIDYETPVIITKYQLFQNYPNPFNPSTTIKYRLANQKSQTTILQIYNNLGQLVRTLVNSEQGNGEYTVVWDGLDENSNEVASGIYFYKLQSSEFTSTQKLLKLK